MRLKLAISLALVLALPLAAHSTRKLIHHAVAPEFDAQLTKLIGITERGAADARENLARNPNDFGAARRAALFLMLLHEHRVLLQSTRGPRSAMRENWTEEPEVLAIIDRAHELARSRREQRIAEGLLQRFLTPPVSVQTVFDSAPATAAAFAAYPEAR